MSVFYSKRFLFHDNAQLYVATVSKPNYLLGALVTYKRSTDTSLLLYQKMAPHDHNTVPQHDV